MGTQRNAIGGRWIPELGPVWRALSWNSFATGGKIILGFVRALILARLLSPDDYGLFGLSTVLLTAVSAFTNFRLSSSFIVRKFDSTEERDTFLNTIWTADLARYALVTLLILAGAHHAALYMGDPRLARILLITGLVPFVTGLTNVGLSVLQKEINFKRLSFQALAGEVLQFVIGIGLAWILRNVWAMVWTQLAITAFSVLTSYIVHPFRPRLAFDRTAFFQAFGFGKHLLLVGILTFFTTQLDNFAVGRYLGTAVLGAYLIAYRLATLPLEILSEVVDPVLFSAYAKRKAENSDGLGRMFLGAANGSGLILALAAVAMHAAAYDAIVRLYGAKWTGAVPMLEALVAVGLARGLTRTLSPLLLAFGRSGLDAAAKCVEAAVFIPATLVLVQRYGASGAAVAGAVSYGIGVAIRAGFVMKVMPEIRRRFLLSAGNQVVLGTLAYGATILLRAHMPGIFAAVLVMPAHAAAVLATNPPLREYVRTCWPRQRGAVVR